MRKIIAMLCSITIIGTASTQIIACKSETQKDYSVDNFELPNSWEALALHQLTESLKDENGKTMKDLYKDSVVSSYEISSWKMNTKSDTLNFQFKPKNDFMPKNYYELWDKISETANAKLSDENINTFKQLTKSLNNVLDTAKITKRLHQFEALPKHLQQLYGIRLNKPIEIEVYDLSGYTFDLNISKNIELLSIEFKEVSYNLMGQTFSSFKMDVINTFKVKMKIFDSNNNEVYNHDFTKSVLLFDYALKSNQNKSSHTLNESIFKLNMTNYEKNINDESYKDLDEETKRTTAVKKLFEEKLEQAADGQIIKFLNLIYEVNIEKIGDSNLYNLYLTASNGNSNQRINIKTTIEIT